MQAASGSREDIVRLLLLQGANANQFDEQGMTALSLATSHVVVQQLLFYGADPNAVDQTGKTVLHHAMFDRIGWWQQFEADFSNTIRNLLHVGADPRVRDREGRNAVQLFDELFLRTEEHRPGQSHEEERRRTRLRNKAYYRNEDDLYDYGRWRESLSEMRCLISTTLQSYERKALRDREPGKLCV